MRYSFPILLIIVSVVFMQDVACGDYVMEDLYAYWSFDRSTVAGATIEDLGGNSNAKINGDPKMIPGRSGEAIEFDGEDDYLDLTILKGFGPELGAFSVDFWLKSGPLQDWAPLFKTLSDGLSMGWSITLNRDINGDYQQGATRFYVRDSSGKPLVGQINAPVYDNAWHHIAWVVENASSNIYKIYVDGDLQGVEYGKTQAPMDFIDFQHPVYLGAGNARGQMERPCKVAVDDFRLYTGILTEAEILQNISSGAAVDMSGKLPAVWGGLKVGR